MLDTSMRVTKPKVAFCVVHAVTTIAKTRRIYKSVYANLRTPSCANNNALLTFFKFSFIKSNLRAKPQQFSPARPPKKIGAFIL